MSLAEADPCDAMRSPSKRDSIAEVPSDEAVSNMLPRPYESPQRNTLALYAHESFYLSAASPSQRDTDNYRRFLEEKGD